MALTKIIDQIEAKRLLMAISPANILLLEPPDDDHQQGEITHQDWSICAGESRATKRGQIVNVEVLSSRDIGDAWFAAYHACLEHGRAYTIERGSFKGQQRKQLDALALHIEHPESRPLGVAFSGRPISDDESTHRYFENYLVDPTIAPNEAYTYASRITPYLEIVAAMLRETPGTNQATIEVARPEDILLLDPPCLRVLSWKTTPRGLQLTSFWRSWDIHAAMATNLGGLQLLNELVAEWAGLAPGHLVAYSDGAHVYDHAW